MAVNPTRTDGHLSRAAARGAAIGFVVVTAIFFAVGVLQGLGADSSLLIGVFAGIWAGVGFGAMFGAVLAMTREEMDG